MQKLTLPQTKIEILSGVTVALALVPEAIAFAFVAHLNPLVGLYAAFIVGFVTSILGGRPAMISGATGALAVVMVSLVVQYGVEYLFASVLLMGILQILAGILRFGKFIRIVPYPVILGFVNGLAIVIFLAQLEQFKTLDASGNTVWLVNNALYLMLGLVGATMAIIYITPKITKTIPAPLIAIIIIALVVRLLELDVRVVGDMASIAGSLPNFHIPIVPLNFETLKIILPYSLIFAGIGLIESLLTLTLIDEMTRTRGKNSRECIAQGTANIICGFFGAMGGCAMIGQSMINISSGARHRLSGIIAALSLLGFILFGASIIEKIPLAALTGVMFMVVIGTFAWSSLQIMHKIPISDAFVIIIVSVVTVATDLAIAVMVGIIISALVYAWQSAQHITAIIDDESQENTRIYKLYGGIFFGSAVSFKDLFNPKTDPQNIIINFEHSRVWDHSGLEALKKLAARYKEEDKNIKYRRLSVSCAAMLEKSGCQVEKDMEFDPHYSVVMDYNTDKT